MSGRTRAEKRRKGKGRKAAPPAPRRSPRRWGLAVLVVLAALFVAQTVVFQFTQDDAYISLRYARNLVEGHGLVFNPGERVEGYSNFAWTMLMAAVLKLGLPPVQSARWLGVTFALGALLLAARLARSLEGRWGPAALGTAALVAGTSALAMWCTGGLETALFALLVTAGLERGLAPDVSPRGRLAAPVLLSLAALTRPDGPLVFALFFLGRLADPDRRRGLIRDAVLFAAPLIPYALWKLSYYGELLPNTYYAKAGTSSDYFVRGVRYAVEYFHGYGAWGVAPALAVLAVVRAGLRSVEAKLLLVWCGYAAYIVVVGGDVLHVHRFWLPILPIGAILVARGAVRLGEWFADRRGGAPALGAGLAALLVLLLVGSGLARNWNGIQTRRLTEIGFVDNMAQTGTWLGENLPPGSPIAITTIGAVGYFSGLPVIDMLGLTDPEIARSPVMIEGLTDTWREIKYDAESVLRRAPEMILFSTGVRPSAAAEKALFLYESFYESYYDYYFRSLPTRTQTQVGFRRAKDAPPFRPDRLPIRDLTFLEAYGDAHLAQSRSLDYKTAAELFAKSVELAGGRFPSGKEWLGAALYDGQRADEGIRVLREAVAEDSSSVVALIRLADHALAEDPAHAARLFEKIIELDPADSQAWLGRAEASRLQGDLESALRYAVEGIKRWDSGPPQLAQLGGLAAALGRFEQAEQCYRRALAVDPKYEPAIRALEIVGALRRGDLQLPPPPSEKKAGG